MINHAKLTAALASIEDLGINPFHLATAIIAEYDKPTEQVWECKIGGRVNVPPDADGPMRAAIEEAFVALTGEEPEFLFSGWGGKLNPLEQEARKTGPIPIEERRTVAVGYTGVPLDALIDALRHWYVEVDRPRGKFESERLWDLTQQFFNQPLYRYELLRRLEDVLRKWKSAKRPNKPSSLDRELMRITEEYFNV